MICPNCQAEKRGAACPKCGVVEGMPASRPMRQHSNPYQGRSATSRSGALTAAAAAPSQRDVIVSWVRDHGNVTNSEISAALTESVGRSYSINVVSARVNAELGPGGRLMRTGARPCRVTGHEANTVAYRGAS